MWRRQDTSQDRVTQSINAAGEESGICEESRVSGLSGKKKIFFFNHIDKIEFEILEQCPMRKVLQVVWNENTITGRFRRQKMLPIFFIFGCCFSIHFLFFAYLLNTYTSWVLSFPSFLTWYPEWLCNHLHCANPSQLSLLSFKHGTLPFEYLIRISNYHQITLWKSLIHV